MTAKLRHVALHTSDVRATADFYKTAFGMEELGHGESPAAESVRLTDGTMNLTILRFKDMKMADRLDGFGAQMGLHHIGFWVDDVEEARKRLAEAGAEYRADLESGGQGRGSGVEEKYRGPESMMIDISGHGWAGAKPPSE
jgi:catechol 2,3-dioxygenase-like lactoylglutathione lyase family enzyme